MLHLNLLAICSNHKLQKDSRCTGVGEGDGDGVGLRGGVGEGVGEGVGVVGVVGVVGGVPTTGLIADCRPFATRTSNPRMLLFK